MAEKKCKKVKLHFVFCLVINDFSWPLWWQTKYLQVARINRLCDHPKMKMKNCGIEEEEEKEKEEDDEED